MKKLLFLSLFSMAANANGVHFNQWISEPSVYDVGYKKIANDGSILPDTVELGDAENRWACSLDNSTALIWEVKTDDGGLRDKDNTFTPHSDVVGSFASYQNDASCVDGVPCDAESYVQTINAQNLCGYNDWRIPTKDELTQLSNSSYTASIDLNFFPNSTDAEVLSATPRIVNQHGVWLIYAEEGYISNYGYGANNHLAIRLVRDWH